MFKIDFDDEALDGYPLIFWALLVLKQKDDISRFLGGTYCNPARLLLENIEPIYKQQPRFDPKICSGICPQTLSVLRCKCKFSKSIA